MCMLERRVHILLDEERYSKVAREASRRSQSVAAVIREAIDRLPPDGHDARRTSIEAILAAPPMSVPIQPAELRRELDSGHDRKHQ